MQFTFKKENPASLAFLSRALFAYPKSRALGLLLHRPLALTMEKKYSRLSWDRQHVMKKDIGELPWKTSGIKEINEFILKIKSRIPNSPSF
jgi:hypothetical protein